MKRLLSILIVFFLKFGNAFETRFVAQEKNENRTIETTLDLGWELLSMLPREELDRIDTKILDKYYRTEEEILEQKERNSENTLEETNK